MGYVVLAAVIEKITKLSWIDAYKKYILKPLNMKHTDIGDANITLYMKDLRKLNKNEKLEKYMVCSLYSCVFDMLKFGEGLHTLLNKSTLDLFKNFPKNYREDKKMNIISHNGYMWETISNFEFKFDSKWNLKDFYIKFETNAT